MIKQAPTHVSLVTAPPPLLPSRALSLFSLRVKLPGSTCMIHDSIYRARPNPRSAVRHLAGITTNPQTFLPYFYIAGERWRTTTTMFYKRIRLNKRCAQLHPAAGLRTVKDHLLRRYKSRPSYFMTSSAAKAADLKPTAAPAKRPSKPSDPETAAPHVPARSSQHSQTKEGSSSAAAASARRTLLDAVAMYID